MEWLCLPRADSPSVSGRRSIVQRGSLPLGPRRSRYLFTGVTCRGRTCSRRRAQELRLDDRQRTAVIGTSSPEREAIRRRVPNEAMRQQTLSAWLMLPWPCRTPSQLLASFRLWPFRWNMAVRRRGDDKSSVTSGELQLDSRQHAVRDGWCRGMVTKRCGAARPPGRSVLERRATFDALDETGCLSASTARSSTGGTG